MTLKIHFFIFLLFVNIPVHALNFSSTYLKLNCPERGNVEIILHVYNHTQEKWKDNFETGAGHKSAGNVDIIQFVNGDSLFHDRKNDSFDYVYYGEKHLHHCMKLAERSVYPTF